MTGVSCIEYSSLAFSIFVISFFFKPYIIFIAPPPHSQEILQALLAKEVKNPSLLYCCTIPLKVNMKQSWLLCHNT